MTSTEITAPTEAGLNKPVSQLEVRGWNFALMPNGWVAVSKDRLVAHSILLDRDDWNSIVQAMWVASAPEIDDEPPA